MITINTPRTAYFDVDDTLVIWNLTLENSSRAVEVKGPTMTEWLVPHFEHILRLKRHKKRGDSVVVWSQGGADWAEAVVRALGISEYVDVCLQKPSVYYDDLPATAWIGTNLYFKQHP
jgi:hypothetical protein